MYEDQLDALERDSKRVGNAGEHIDYALLLDGLKAEREQGITIDVAYRYFSTNGRKFIIADTPGHEQYTRNMITGGSTANLAIILVDARMGVITQTRRHTFLVSLLGIKHVVLAVNKMDLVDFSEERFNEIVAEYKKFVAPLGIPDVNCIPLSALDGDNVVDKSETQLQNPLHPYGTIPVPLQVLFLHPLHTLLLLPHVDAAAHVLASSTPRILLYFCFHIPIALTSNSFYLYSLFLHSPSCFHYSSDQIHCRSQQNHHQYRYHTNFTSGYNTDTHIPITITTISIW